jgi:hypothetical protein
MLCCFRKRREQSAQVGDPTRADEAQGKLSNSGVYYCF